MCRQSERTPAAEDAAYYRAIAMLDQINGMQRVPVRDPGAQSPGPADAIEAAKRDDA